MKHFGHIVTVGIFIGFFAFESLIIEYSESYIAF